MTSDAGQPRLGLGVVGMGTAFQLMAPSIVTHPLVRVVAGADVRPEARQRFGSDFGAATYSTVEELCRDRAVDLVYIATPHQFHADQAVAAARLGKHVIVEKPLALTLEDCELIIDAVDSAGVKLIVGHTNSYDPPIVEMRRIVRGGDLGQLRMIHTFNYTPFLYRARRPEELDTDLGGGIIFNQVPHQVDMVRFIAGGMVRSVRAYTGVWAPQRPTEGSMAAFLDFEDGVVAIAVYSGYDHFNADEYKGRPPNPETYGVARRRLSGVRSRQEEGALKSAQGYGGPRQSVPVPTTTAESPPVTEHETFGEIIVGCDRGDIRGSPQGVTVYGDEEVRKIAVPFGRGGGRRNTVFDEIYDAIVLERPLVHHARWATATLEVCLAILESSRSRREVFLSRQCAVQDL